jgi:hypothetical protein
MQQPRFDDGLDSVLLASDRIFDGLEIDRDLAVHSKRRLLAVDLESNARVAELDTGGHSAHEPADRSAGLAGCDQLDRPALSRWQRFVNEDHCAAPALMERSRPGDRRKPGGAVETEAPKLPSNTRQASADSQVP